MAEVEVLLSVQNQLVKGPLWHAVERALYWVDIEGDIGSLLIIL